jgi:hypothetical protein
MSLRRFFRLRGRRTFWTVALLLVALACGDGSFVLIINSGTIVRDPSCGPAGGSFQMRDQGGLVVLVVIDDQTKIFASSGSTGACTDLAAGAVVSVSGTGNDRRIAADEVRVL